MGYRISWIAFRNLDRSALLERTQLAETGRQDEANEAKFSWVALPDGWILVFSNIGDYASEKRLAELSQGVRVIGAEINDTVMYSRIACYENGQRIWSVAHDCEKGSYSLDTIGQLPPVYEEVRERLFAAQDENGGEDSDTDFIYDVPTELGEHLIGYRHDAIMFEPGEPGFMELVSTAPPEPKWWQKLFGKRA